MNRANNFDLIRLFAASEVALVHTIVHLELGQVPSFLSVLPGVPIFFLISGFLIFPSYANSDGLGHYALKRLLRIYPALVVCFVLCIAMLLVIGHLTLNIIATPQFGIWAAAQLTFAQFYNPEFLRSFGAGVLNGSLWTIAVELQFYFLTPILYRALAAFPRAWAPLIGALAVGYAALNDGESLASRLAMVTFLPWLYMFLVGAWLSSRPNVVQTILRLPLVGITAAFAGAAVATYLAGFPVGGNEINPVMFAALAVLVIRLAYTVPSLASKSLRGTDVSYGIYIYHMPVVNLLMWSGAMVSWAWGLLGLTVAALLALASWFCVENPALALLRGRSASRRVRAVDLGR